MMKKDDYFIYFILNILINYLSGCLNKTLKKYYIFYSLFI